MKVFLSWSGDQSHQVADVFCNWLPQIIQALEPWISTNIPKGSRSTSEISSELEKSKIGIICLTPDNLDSNWILFEAGALSRMNDVKVCTFLLGLTQSDIKPPLSQFQHTIFSKEDVFRLLLTINSHLSCSGERSLSENTLNQTFERAWPDFEKDIKKIPSFNREKSAQIRSDRELLEEILVLVRKQNFPNQSNARFTEADIKLLERLQEKYRRLRDEFGVQPSEAVRSVLNDIEKEGIYVSPFFKQEFYDSIRRI